MTRSPKPESLYRKLTSKVANLFKRRQKETPPDRKGFRTHRPTKQQRYHGRNAAHQNKMRAKRRGNAAMVKMSRRKNRNKS